MKPENSSRIQIGCLHKIASILICLLPATALAEAPHIGVNAGVDLATHYIFRGIPQEHEGLVTQPYAEIDFPLYAPDKVFKRLDLTVGMWTSLHTGPTATNLSGRGPENWYETDFYTRLSMVVSDFTLGLQYTGYTSPNGSFPTVHELAAVFSYSDSDPFSRWSKGYFQGFAPSLTVAGELLGTASGDASGTFIGLSIRPSFALYSGKKVRFGAAVPVDVGLSADNYYDDATGDDVFGYVAAGLAATLSLPVIPERLGAWSFTATGRVFHLGDRMAAKYEATFGTFTGGVNVLF